MSKYCETAPDIEVETGKHVLRYYAGAGKFQVSMQCWEDTDGNRRPGRTVEIDTNTLSENADAVRLLESVLDDISKPSRSKE